MRLPTVFNSPESLDQAEVSFVDALTVVNGRVDLDAAVERPGGQVIKLFFCVTDDEA
jgi:hypothetical protein